MFNSRQLDYQYHKDYYMVEYSEITTQPNCRAFDIKCS